MPKSYNHSYPKLRQVPYLSVILHNNTQTSNSPTHLYSDTPDITIIILLRRWFSIRLYTNELINAIHTNNLYFHPLRASNFPHGYSKAIFTLTNVAYIHGTWISRTQAMQLSCSTMHTLLLTYYFITSAVIISSLSF